MDSLENNTPQDILAEVMNSAGWGEERKEAYRRRMSVALLQELIDFSNLMFGDMGIEIKQEEKTL